MIESFPKTEAKRWYFTVADGDSQEFQEVSQPVSWDKDYLKGSWLKQTDVE